MATGSTVIPMGQRIRNLWEGFLHGEYETGTLRSVPSWGLSVLFHALFLLILALIIQFGRGEARPASMESSIVDTQLGDVTSLVPANRSGDPFTLTDSPDPPSLGLEPADSDLKLVGLPEVSSLNHYAPALAGPTPLSDVKGASIVTVKLPELSTNVTAPFSGRQGMTRAKLVRREGGTARSEKSVEEAIGWFARHQRPDGSWSLNYYEQCQPNGCPHHQVMESDTAATGLALLPMLGAGYIHTVKSKYQDTVRRGISWLVDHQQPDGNLFIGPAGMAYMYSHAIGTMALCEAYGLSQDPKLKKPAQLAIQFIVNSQHPTTGGWRYAPGQEGDTSVFGWQIFALRSGHMAKLTVPRHVLKACTRYLDLAAVDQHRIGYAYQPGRGLSFIMTAEALLGRQLLGWPRNHPPLIKGAAQIAANLEVSEDRNIYYWYYATQLLHNMKNKDWERWNLKVRELLIDMQVKTDGCDGGSWDPILPVEDRWGRSAGRLYVTSLSTLTLEVYYRYLPLYRGYDDDQTNDDPMLANDPPTKDEAVKDQPAAKVARKPR